MKKKLWNNDISGSGLIDLNRLKQTSPYVLVFSLFRIHKNAASNIRYYFARIFWKKLPSYGFKNIFWVFKYFIVWPIHFRRVVLKLGRQPYHKVHKLTGKSLFRQICEQFYLAFFYSISPKEYFMCELFFKENKKRVPEYLMRLNFKPLIYAFFDEVYIKENNLSELPSPDSKDYLFQQGIIYKLPIVPIFAKISQKESVFYADREEISKYGDLFVKPEETKGGKQAQIWFKEDTLYRNSEGVKLSFEEILDQIKEMELSSKYSEEFIVQPRIVNHPDVSFGTNSLNTIRVLTLMIDNEVEVPFGALRFSFNKDSNVDNLHAGGGAAPIVNMNTGELGSASDMGFKNPGNWVDYHPINGSKIRGMNLPFWKETHEVIQNGHKMAFKERTLLGWDIALTPQGPLIVECNGWPDNEGIQIIYNKPIGSMRGYQLISKKLEKDFKEFYS